MLSVIDGGPGLTSEERAALSIAAAGLNNDEVAQVMHAPVDIVRAWLASAVDKLGARSKLEAVLIADRTGQLDDGP
jgi:DNA-binding NarL/FixJ family response regulator